MGRIMDLCGEIAAEAEEGPGGLVLPPEAHERLRADWDDDDIDDAMGLVRDSLLQSELVEAADNLSARMVEVLGSFGDAAAFAMAGAGGAALSVEVLDQLVRRVSRLEEVIQVYREGTPPDRRGFDALQRRLMDLGIEKEMYGEKPGRDETASDDNDEDE